MKSLAEKFTGREMMRTFNQMEAFTTHIIPREMTLKALEILADNRNILSSTEIQKIRHTFVNSSKNLRQNLNDEKYSVNINRCKIFMDCKQGQRNNLLKQHEYDDVVYQCCSLHLVTRTTIPTSGELLILFILNIRQLNLLFILLQYSFIRYK